ncbi:MAG: hypothetical protein U0J65_05305 [Christensenellales bacterium]|nr:hypothetical protein [Christensenellales bacterium]
MKKKIAMVALWLAALVACLLLLDRGMRRDDSERKYGAFFAEKQDFDVLFFGTSRVLDGITPMELWRDYGLTSYNMGNNSEPLGVTRWVLETALETHTPKVAVFEVFYVEHAVDEAWTYSFRHLFYDALPLSGMKIRAVCATQPEGERMEFLMPFSLYHGRWDEILSGQSERLVECEPFMMGGEMRLSRQIRDNYAFTDEMESAELPGYAALREIAAVCRAHEVQPVFVALPGHASEEEQRNMNGVQRVADELGVPFVNIQRLGIVDNQTDCYDWQGHLNPDGASKATAYLGEWLTARYELADHRGEEGYAHWDENLVQYEAYRAENWVGSEER